MKKKKKKKNLLPLSLCFSFISQTNKEALAIRCEEKHLIQLGHDFLIRYP